MTHHNSENNNLVDTANANELSRRRFLQFVGAGVGAAQMGALSILNTNCATSQKGAIPAAGSVASDIYEKVQGNLFFKPIGPSDADSLVLASPLRYNVLCKEGDLLQGTERFGSQNDFTAFISLPYQRSKFPRKKASVTTEGILWVNNESLGNKYGQKKTDSRPKDAVDAEMLEVGGSFLHVKKGVGGVWALVPQSRYNRRMTAKTAIPFSSGFKIDGKKTAIGTLANCAGGTTPWNTILTCEENYQDFYGEAKWEKGKVVGRTPSTYGWESVYAHSPLHYGWVVEIHPITLEAKKLIPLGRFGHEGATTVKASSGQCVVYMGDDAADCCLYKFISDTAGSLERGTLYVAGLEQKKWIPLDIKKTPSLRKEFYTQLEVLIRAREAGKVAGGTLLDRPEDIEISPVTGEVFVALTNNAKKENHFGSILKIAEKNNDPLSLEFEWATFLTGGEENKFACPDNFAFDQKGNLWMCTDISGSSMSKSHYSSFKNNGLFFIPTSGEGAGSVFQVASAPKDAEFTGPSFSPDGKTLFLSVQHPGETSKDRENPTSRWPLGAGQLPLSAVVAIDIPTK